MREFLYRLVRRLHEEARPLSRNKHFFAPVDEILQRGGEVLDLGMSPSPLLPLTHSLHRASLHRQ